MREIPEYAIHCSKMSLKCKFNLSGSTTARRYPLSYIFSGFGGFHDGTVKLQETYALFWASAAYSSSNAYRLTINEGALNPQADHNKALGMTLRCFLKI